MNPILYGYMYQGNVEYVQFTKRIMEKNMVTALMSYIGYILGLEKIELPNLKPF